MRLFGFDLTFGKGCPDCERLERQLASLRMQQKALADNQIALIDEIRDLRAEKDRREREAKIVADTLLDLAALGGGR
jgi:cell division protein FtsB